MVVEEAGQKRSDFSEIRKIPLRVSTEIFDFFSDNLLHRKFRQRCTLMHRIDTIVFDFNTLMHESTQLKKIKSVCIR